MKPGVERRELRMEHHRSFPSDKPLTLTLPVLTPRFSEAVSSGAELRPFSFAPDMSLAGGIKKVPDGPGVLKMGLGGVCVFWFVDGIATTAGVIERARGKMVGMP
jgi:hypothetical protein